MSETRRKGEVWRITRLRSRGKKGNFPVRLASGAVADNDEQQDAQVFMPAEQAAGVYANWAQVSHSDHEFTLDFVRMDYSAQPLRGVVVARVSVSPLFITQLISALEDNWRLYAEKALPKDVRGDDAAH
jgi:uncharacterized protein DUF3467